MRFCKTQNPKKMFNGLYFCKIIYAMRRKNGTGIEAVENR